MPLYVPGEDPGTDFLNLLRQNGLDPFPTSLPGTIDAGHATTVLALRCTGGVVVAGDRRATAGHLISHRDMQKVFPADEHSAVAIAGAAGPAIQMLSLIHI